MIYYLMRSPPRNSNLITKCAQVKMYKILNTLCIMWLFVSDRTIGINQASKLIRYAICRLKYSIHYKMRVISLDKPQAEKKETIKSYIFL